jgi:tetratricopeptide (TPR) repeat protein
MALKTVLKKTGIVLAALTAAALCCLAGELSYRGFWAVRRAWGSRGDKTAYFDLYVAGESTAVGEPYAPGIMFSSLLDGMFGGRLGGRELRIFDLARPGESSYPQAVKLGRALRLHNRSEPGVVLIYSGNNDIGAARGVPFFEFLREKFLSRSLLLEDLLYCVEKLSPRLRARTLDTYEYNMRRMTELSLAAGLTPMLCTVVSDISDVDPGLFSDSPAERAALRDAAERGLLLEASGKRPEAAAYYSGLEKSMPAMLAYAQYRRGKCLLTLGRPAEARECLRKAVDSAGRDNFGRATSQQNDIVRALAAEYRVPLVDAAKIFDAASPEGITGSSFFSDGQHPNMAGYLLLAGGFARQLSVLTGDPVRKSYGSSEEVFRAFSFGKEKQSLAFMDSGRWLFSVAARDALSLERLEMARRRFRQAAALRPGSFSPLLGLGLVDAAESSGLLSGMDDLKWLAKQDFFYGGKYDVPYSRLPAVLKKLSARGVPQKELEEIRAAAERERSASGTAEPPATR